MRALVSNSSGMCAYEDNAVLHFVDTRKFEKIPNNIAHLTCGCIDDWVETSVTDLDAMLSEAKTSTLRFRAVNNIEQCVMGVSQKLQAALLDDSESIIKELGVDDRLFSMLLKAPLKNSDGLKSIAEVALSQGFAVTSSIIDQVFEYQPHLRRLTDFWLSIPAGEFVNIRGERQRVWQLAIENGLIYKTLKAENGLEILNIWSHLSFKTQNPNERLAFSGIARQVSNFLFPEYESASPEFLGIDKSGNKEYFEKEPDTHRMYESALKQIEAISHAVESGNDSKAEKYLAELVNIQTSYQGGKEYAVKSLCNIAKHCAEMFRTDFELKCLKMAVDINQRDSWTLIQLADHYKRVGRFDDAIYYLNKASDFGEKRVAMTSRADVYVQMRQFEKAIELYKGVEGWLNDSLIRTAIADALRKSGNLNDAWDEYEKLRAEGVANDRILAGLAEIDKRKGRLDSARAKYEALLSDKTIDDNAQFVYTLAFSNVLVRSGDLPTALSKLDQLVQKKPFARQARAFRAAVLGLLGKPEKVIEELPPLGQSHAFSEWVNNYVRGLALLMLDRYSDARSLLQEKYEDRILDSDSKGTRLLGSAVDFLRTKEGLDDASQILKKEHVFEDSFAEEIWMTLQFHVAMAQQNSKEIARLRNKLSKIKDNELVDLVKAIEERNWKKAWKIEVRTAMKLAA